MNNAIEKVYAEEKAGGAYLHTEWNFMGKSKIPEILWHNCVKVPVSEYAELGITVAKKLKDADNPLEIDASQTVFRINGWTKPPNKIEIGDVVSGIMYMTGSSIVIAVEYSDHPGHFGSKAHIKGKPKIVDVKDEAGNKIGQTVEDTYQIKFVRDNEADAKDSRFLVYAVGKAFIPKPKEDAKDMKPKTKADIKAESKFIDPGDVPDDNN